MFKRCFGSCLLLIAVVVAPPAAALQAQDDGQEDRRQEFVKPFAQRIMKQSDTNMDGKLDMDEVKAAPQRSQVMMAEADTNNDGLIDLKELAASMVKTQARVRNRPRGFNAYDLNNDKSLSKEELGDFWKRVQDGDENEDGAISEAEYKTAQKARTVKRRQELLASFDEADANKDGKLSDEEREGKRNLTIIASRANADEDGSISRKEWTQIVERTNFALLPPRRARRGRQGGANPDGSFLMVRLDKNKDDKLDKEEIEAGNPRIKEMLNRADSNEDGFVTRDEIAASVRKFIEERRRQGIPGRRGAGNRGGSEGEN